MIKPDIIDIIMSEGVNLRKIGQSYKGLCPFHGEKTASFLVNEHRQTYHCFGCGDRGDVIDFIMKTHSLTFSEAIRYLNINNNSEEFKEKRLKNALKRQKKEEEKDRIRFLAESLYLLPQGISKAIKKQDWKLLAHYYHTRTQWEYEWFTLTGIEI